MQPEKFDVLLLPEPVRRHRLGPVRRPGRRARRGAGGANLGDRTSACSRRCTAARRTSPARTGQPDGAAALGAADAAAHRRARRGRRGSARRSRAVLSPAACARAIWEARRRRRHSPTRCAAELDAAPDRPRTAGRRAAACYSPTRVRCWTTSPRRCWPGRRSRSTCAAGTARAARRRASASTPTSKSCARPSGTRSTGRSSIRSTRSSARSSGIAEQIDHVQRGRADGAGVVYASNHKSHTDYLVEPLVLDDNGIRPPVIAAGINLFGGPLGLLHRHVTGAIPIRRNTKDPAYLITLKAYVAEILQAARPVLLSGGRAQLQRGAEVDRRPGCSTRRSAPDGAEPRRSCRWRSRTTSCSRTTSSRGSGSRRRQRPFSARAGGDGPLRGRVPVARVRHLRAGRFRSGECDPQSRRDVLELAPGRPRTRSARCTRCCRRRVRRGDAAVDHARATSRSGSTRFSRTLAARPRQPRRRQRPGGGRRRRRAARDARHRRPGRADGSASASAACCATTRAPSNTCS